MKDAKIEFINSVNFNADSDFPYLVLDGEIEVKTLTTSATLDAGSGIFV